MSRLRALFGADEAPAKSSGKSLSVPSRGVSRQVCSTWKACHAVFAPGCAQCRFRAFGDKWTKTYGMVVHKGQKSRTVTWLRERRPEPGVAWAVGCAVCASLRWRLQTCQAAQAAGPLQLCGLRCDTKWARLDVCRISRMNEYAFQQHSLTNLHKVAMHLYLRPELPLETVIGDANVAVAVSLLQGAVPPPEHWLRVWRFVRTPTSFRGIQAILDMDGFLSHLRTGKDREETHRHAIRKSIGCMAEVIKIRAREVLLAAHSVTIAVDDRGPYRLIRYRCDAEAAAVPLSESVSDLRTGSVRCVCCHDGIIGVHCTAASKSETLESLDDDYSEKMRDSIVSSVEELFRVDGRVDTAQASTVFAKIHTFIGDGATSVQKCGALLRAGRCRNIALIL